MKKVIIVTGSNRVKRAREIQNKIYRLELAEKCVVFESSNAIHLMDNAINRGEQVIITSDKRTISDILGKYNDALIVDSDFVL